VQSKSRERREAIVRFERLIRGRATGPHQNYLKGKREEEMSDKKKGIRRGDKKRGGQIVLVRATWCLGGKHEKNQAIRCLLVMKGRTKCVSRGFPNLSNTRSGSGWRCALAQAMDTFCLRRPLSLGLSSG